MRTYFRDTFALFGVEIVSTADEKVDKQRGGRMTSEGTPALSTSHASLALVLSALC